MPNHWAVDARVASDDPQKRATAHVQNAFHGLVDKDVGAQKASIGMVSSQAEKFNREPRQANTQSAGDMADTRSYIETSFWLNN